MTYQNKNISHCTHRREQGSVLIIAVLLTSLFLAIGITIARIGVSGFKSSSEHVESLVAYQHAEMGMELALSGVYNGICSGNIEAFMECGTSRTFNCVSTSILRSSENDFQFVLYRTDDTPIRCSDLVIGGTPARDQIGSVKVWGIYGNTIRSIKSKIVKSPPP